MLVKYKLLYLNVIQIESNCVSVIYMTNHKSLPSEFINLLNILDINHAQHLNK